MLDPNIHIIIKQSELSWSSVGQRNWIVTYAWNHENTSSLVATDWVALFPPANVTSILLSHIWMDAVRRVQLTERRLSWLDHRLRILQISIEDWLDAVCLLVQSLCFPAYVIPLRKLEFVFQHHWMSPLLLLVLYLVVHFSLRHESAVAEFIVRGSHVALVLTLCGVRLS